MLSLQSLPSNDNRLGRAQTFRQGLGAAWESLRRFWLLNLVMFGSIAVTAQLVTVLSEAALFAILGIGVCGFALIQLLGLRMPRPSPRRLKVVEACVAMVAGFFGGLSGVWGPPILMYFMALELPKVEMVRAQGVSFLLGSMILVAAHLRSGLLLGEGGQLPQRRLTSGGAVGGGGGRGALERAEDVT